MDAPEAVRTLLLRDIRHRLDAHYGKRLERLVLFGSEARGDTHTGSDVDVLVVLTPPVATLREIKVLSGIAYDLEREYDRTVQFVVTTEERYRAAWHPLMLNVQRDGIAV